MATHEQAIQMLSRGEHGLGDVLPKSSATRSSSTGSLSARENLKGLMLEVDQLKRERETLEASLKTVAFDMKTPFLKVCEVNFLCINIYLHFLRELFN